MVRVFCTVPSSLAMKVLSMSTWFRYHSTDGTGSPEVQYSSVQYSSVQYVLGHGFHIRWLFISRCACMMYNMSCSICKWHLEPSADKCGYQEDYRDEMTPFVKN